MRRIATLFIIAALGTALACDDAPESGPAAPQLGSSAEDLIDLLPGSTLVAVELRDLDSRWDALRAIAPLARLQDHVLDELGLDAAAIPTIAGPRAVLAFVADDASRGIVPLVVLDPPSHEAALESLAASDALVAAQSRGAIWAGPAHHARLLERIAAGDGTSLRQAVDFLALAEHLPAGGLVRAVLNPKAFGEWLWRVAEFEGTRPVGKLARLLAVDCDAIEVAGFRRDIEDGELVTDVWVGIDGDVAPPELTRALATHRGPAQLPSQLPAGVIMAKSFRTEAEAGLATLRAHAARDPGGPLRNLDFWIDEFEAWSGRDVESDIVAALGAQGASLLLEGEDEGSLELVVILDADDPARLEAALIDLRNWVAEQIMGRSLGLALPQNRDGETESGAVHGLDFRGPFVNVSGPVFQLVDDHLVVATNRHTLELGVELAGSAETWVTPAWALADGPPDEIALIRTSALAGLLTAASSDVLGRASLGDAIADFLAATGEGRLRVYYEESGFRMSGQLGID